MPAVSKKQQRFFGMVRAAHKGEGAASPEVAKVASEISKEDAKKFAKTKHKGLPMKKEETVFEGDVHSGQGEKIQKRTLEWMRKKGQKGAPGLDAMKARTAEHKAKRGVKEEVVDETYYSDNTRGVSTKGGLRHQYNKPGKLSQSSFSHERKSKNPELRMSKKELRKSMEDDASYEKKMGRSKPTPSNLKTALKKQGANEQVTFGEWNEYFGKQPDIEGAIEYFYEEGLNEEGIDQLIEEIGLETFIDFVEDGTVELNEERAARKASVRAKKYDVVKKEVDKADAARKKAKKGEYAPSYAKKETDVTVYDDKPAAKKKATAKKATPAKKAAPAKKPAAPKKPVTKKVVKAVAKVKKTQPAKKATKQGLGDRIRSAYKAGVKRHRKATQVPRVFAKGAVAGAKKAVKFAKDVKKVVSEEVTFESWKDRAGDAIKKVMKKKDAPKHDYGKDAGAEARKKLKDKEHNKYVSFLDAPDD